MILFVKLLLAHLIGDFLLQPAGWVLAKRKHLLFSWQLYAHAMIQGIIAFILVAQPNFWPWAVFLACTHFLIDIAKLYLTKKYPQFDWFFIDQAAHMLILIFITIGFSGYTLYFDWLNNPKVWLTATAVVLLTYPAAVTIAHIMRGWTKETEEILSRSLKNSGKYIGIFERLLMFVFILYNQWAAIGLLVTAKSVFRFGDLRNSSDRKLTEYILLGSLISMLWAVTISLSYLKILEIMKLS